MSQQLYSILRSHQQLAANAITSGATLGQIIMPTGVGKTLVQVYKILHMIDERREKGITKPIVSVIASHRILLCEQLIQEVVKYAAARGFEFNVLTVASDGVDIQDVAMLTINNNPEGNLGARCTVKRCTSNAEILDFAKETSGQGRQLLVVSTYHSFDRMAGLTVDVACLDEAHTITEEDKFEKVKVMLPHMTQAFFFTATQVTGLNGRGMDNTSFYGRVLCSVAPRSAIDTHDILPPVLHTIQLGQGKVTDRNIIQAAYKAHRNEVLKVSKGRLLPKLLVSVAGVEDMVALLRDNAFHMWATQIGINTVGFSSSMGYYVNGLEVTRKEALQAIRNLKDEDSAIIMHYDILTEGIDLPTITGVMPLRELNKVKFLQTLGRAARLQADDRRDIYSGATRGTEVDSNGKVAPGPNMVKPYYWVILSPKLNEQATDTNLSLVDIIRTSYQVEPEERSQRPLSTTSSVDEAESVLLEKPLLPKEIEVTQYNHVFEALVFQEIASPLQVTRLFVQREAGLTDQQVKLLSEQQVNKMYDDLKKKMDQKEVDELRSDIEKELRSQQVSLVTNLLQGMKNATQSQVPQASPVPPVPVAPPPVPQGGSAKPSLPRKSSFDSFLGLYSK